MSVSKVGVVKFDLICSYGLTCTIRMQNPLILFRIQVKSSTQVITALEHGSQETVSHLLNAIIASMTRKAEK